MPYAVAAPPPTLDLVLSPPQADFVLDNQHKFLAMVGGRGSGKSHAGCLKDILFLLEHPGAEMMIAAPNHPWLRDTTRKTFFEILATFPGGAASYIKAYNKTENVVWFQNGSIGYFRSMDNPDTIRGLNLAAGHIDEAGYVSHRAWEVFKACLRQGGGYPLQGWITTTPTGYNWIWEEWDQKPTPEHRLIKAPTRTNRFLPDPEKFIADLGYEGTFRAQEVEGEFVSFEGLVYPAFDPSQRGGHVRRVEPLGPKPKRVLAGVDWGFKDPAVLLVVADMGDGVYWLLEEWYETKKTADEIAAAAFDLYTRYGIEAFYCDPSRPDSILTLANRLALPIVHEANNDILTGIQAVTSLLKKRGDGLYGLYVDPSCTRTITEFSKYQYPDEKSPEQTSGRRAKNAGEKPLDKDNHTLDCVRYIAMAVDPGLGRRGFGAYGTKEGWF